MSYLFPEAAALKLVSELLDGSAFDEPKLLFAGVARVDEMFGSKDDSFEMSSHFN